MYRFVSQQTTSMAMVLVLNMHMSVCIAGICTGHMISNLQLLTIYHLSQDPRIKRPEVQLACGFVLLSTLNYIASSATCLKVADVGFTELVKYVVSFTPRY